MKSKLVKYIISNKKENDLLNPDLAAHRILCILAVIAIPIFWIFHKSVDFNAIDSITVRLLFSLLFFCIFLASFKIKYVKNNIINFIEVLYYFLTLWLIYITYLNRFSYVYSFAVAITGFSVTIFEFKRRIYLIMYPLTVLVFSSIASFYVTNPQINPQLYISNLFTVGLISYIVSNSRFKSQEENTIREELMTTIFDEAVDALFLVDPETDKIMSCNIYAENTFEMKELVEIGVSIKNAVMIKGEEVDICYEIKQHGVFTTELEYITKQEKKIWGDIVIKEIKIAGEAIFLVRISDITARKQAENALQQAKDELERRVEERTAELSQSNLLLKQEISDRQQAEEQLAYSAFHDALTGLPNRALFVERLRQAVERAKQYEGYLFGVLFLDLDRFKVVNDSLGHMAGDQLLLAIAKRIKTCLRLDDIVARIGGDEFTILLEGIRDVNEAKGVASRIQEQLKLPFNLSGNEVFTSTSIGIALSVTGYDKPEQILRDADMAMYKAKMFGKARHEVFDITMHSAAVARLQMETDLRRAIERQEFRLHYQPIISLDSGTINGFEALVRWQHPEHGLVSPAEFIPLAEETGLIVPLGWWVIREACSQMQVWQAQFLANPLTISVNISGRQFSELDLSQRIEQILQQYRLDPHTLKLEITESAIVENAESATVMLAQLRKLGIQLCMDDFGTGYSSLSYLHRFPIDMLKIDRSFVSRMSFDNEDSEIVRTIVTLAHNLGMSVTAEGVETAEHVALLKELQCEYGQGYFFSKPIDSEAATALIPRLGIG